MKTTLREEYGERALRQSLILLVSILLFLITLVIGVFLLMFICLLLILVAIQRVIDAVKDYEDMSWASDEYGDW